MAARSPENEEMPGKVNLAQPGVPKKNQTGGISNPAGEKPDDSVSGDCLHERADGKQDQPAHSDIERYRQFLPADSAAKLHYNPRQGEQPDHAEHRPANGTAKRSE